MSIISKAPSANTLSFLIRTADFVSILLAAYLALTIRNFIDLPIPMPENLTRYLILAGMSSMSFLLLADDLYRTVSTHLTPVLLIKVIGRWIMLVGLIVFSLFIFRVSIHFSRFWFAAWVPMVTIFLCLDRLAIYTVLNSLQKQGLNLKTVALVGDGPVAKSIKRRLENDPYSGYSLNLELPQVDTQSLQSLSETPIDEVWLALPLGNEQVIQDSLHALRHSTAAIRFIPDMFTLQMINHSISDVMGITMFNLSASPLVGFNLWIKWLEDKLLSLLILIAISPVMLLLAIGVKLNSAGPVFYKQERIGLNNKPFNLLKFRSMPVSTEKQTITWGGSVSKTTTGFGRFIRKTSLDELPQFFNVLKGDMSIVGPRPERTIFVEQFKDEIPDYMKKHLVKAGITGWAQINGLRGDTDINARIEYDIFYIENWSLWLDIKIIILTLFRGFINKNAY